MIRGLVNTKEAFSIKSILFGIGTSLILIMGSLMTTTYLINKNYISIDTSKYIILITHFISMYLGSIVAEKTGAATNLLKGILSSFVYSVLVVGVGIVFFEGLTAASLLLFILSIISGMLAHLTINSAFRNNKTRKKRRGSW